MAGVHSLLKQYGDRIGKEAYWVVDAAIKVRVMVHDAKDSFGHIRFLISPLKGLGEKWVDIKNLEFLSEAPRDQ